MGMTFVKASMVLKKMTMMITNYGGGSDYSANGGDVHYIDIEVVD